MQTLLPAVGYVALILLPPLISGPLPVILVFKVASSLKWKRLLPAAILLTIILNLIALALIISTLDGFLPPGYFACGLTTIAAVATLIASLFLLRRTDQDPHIEPIQRRWLRLCLFGVPAVQIVMVTIIVLIAPALCGTAIRNCTGG